MFVQEAKVRLKKAVIDKNESEKNILRVLLTEIETLELKKGKTPTDRDCHFVVYKLASINESVITQAKTQNNNTLIEKLEAENVILNTLAPKLWTREEIIKFLTDNNLIEKIKQAKDDGPAIGLTMKAINNANAPVMGETIKTIVEELRS
jgi:uncharacterized protein YqeY